MTTKYVPQHRYKLRQILTSWRHWKRGIAPSAASAMGAAVTIAVPRWPTFTLVVLAVFATVVVLGGLARLARGDWPLARSSVRGLTDLAVMLAGRKRPALRAEWRAHLAGESGHDPVTWRNIKEARGFVASAIRCRCSDAADAAWTPVDAILKSRTLSNLFTLIPTGLAALTLFRHGGTVGLLGSAESISAIYLTLYALVLGGRKYRDVKPPEPKARRVQK